MPKLPNGLYDTLVTFGRGLLVGGCIVALLGSRLRRDLHGDADGTLTT